MSILQSETKENVYLAVALRDLVVFPSSVVPLFVGRRQSIQTLQRAAQENNKVVLLAQRDAQIDDPSPDDLFSVGTLVNILQIAHLPDGSLKVLVEGMSRIQITHLQQEEDVLRAHGQELVTIIENTQEVEASRRLVLTELDSYLKTHKKNATDILTSLERIRDTEKMVDLLIPHMTMTVELRQEILATVSLDRRLELILEYLGIEMEVAQVQKRIWRRVKGDLERQQREYVLQMQRKAIENELGDDGFKTELNELEERIKAEALSDEAREKALGELKKLRYMNAMSSEATVVRNYLEWLLALPWGKTPQLSKSLKNAERILDKDHYGLERVKERILEFLAVQIRTGKPQGSVLCLVGPPGVGKTSLGNSIARATKRAFVRFSLGGVRDEAEIRGHRRTYIGAMPGKIVQEMKKAKTCNPLFLLDEIDKTGTDWRGDPASALLEVLDPEQNKNFSDHYLEVGFDLSHVMFVCTANTLNIPPALLDRMEIVRLSGYTEDEKLEIAKRHLIPQQRTASGLKSSEFNITDEAIRLLIVRYCREAGVRNLNRELGRMMRKVVREILLKEQTVVKITKGNLQKYAGIPRYKSGESPLEDTIGTTTGLAWTEAGGELLAVEAVVFPGKGSIKGTGKLGEVMQESIQAALSFVRSKAQAYGILPELFEQRDIHVHVPEGAIPKDGPSAGIAICTSIVSLLTQQPVRGDVAMTGEISLRGRVLPIGGLKEKLLAAHRGGMRVVVIPRENEKDLEEIPQKVLSKLSIHCVETMDEVLALALAQNSETLVTAC